MENINNYPSSKEIPQMPSPDLTDRTEAINKVLNHYFRHLANSRAHGDSESAHDFFLVMINHINKLGITEAEIGASIKQLAIEQALFHKKMIKKLTGRAGQSWEQTWLNDCLRAGGITEKDLADAAVNTPTN